MLSLQTGLADTQHLVGAGPLRGGNPLRFASYESGEGGPKETAKRIQEEAIELSKAAAGAADASGAKTGSGPGAGAAAVSRQLRYAN
jgi:hypothetical protein